MDELLVGIVRQIRLRQTTCRPEVMIGSRDQSSLRSRLSETIQSIFSKFLKRNTRRSAYGKCDDLMTPWRGRFGSRGIKASAWWRLNKLFGIHKWVDIQFHFLLELYISSFCVWSVKFQFLQKYSLSISCHRRFRTCNGSLCDILKIQYKDNNILL